MTDETTPPESEPEAAAPAPEAAPEAAAPEAAAPEAAAPEIEAETLAPEAALATTGNRILAFIIDNLIILALSVVPVVGSLVGLAYLITKDALPFLDGQSIGKKAMKIRAVSSETGKPLTNDWGPAVIRNVVFLIPLFAIVELIVLSNNKDGQRLGDQWAKTKVIVAG